MGTRYSNTSRYNRKMITEDYNFSEYYSINAIKNTETLGVATLKGSMTITPRYNRSILNIDDESETNPIFTTANLIDVDLSYYESGQLIDITLDTATIKADTDIIRIVDSRTHDDAGGDTYKGITIESSGDWPGTTASSVSHLISATYTGTVGASGANHTLYAIYSDTSGATLTSGTMAAGYFTDGTNTITMCDGTTAISISGGIDMDSLDLTPESNIDALDIEMDHATTTTASAIDINSSTRVGSNSTSVIDVSLTGASITASEKIFYITESRTDHDDAAGDDYRGMYIAMATNYPGTNATSDIYLVGGEYTGALGSAGANANLHVLRGDISTATITAGYASAVTGYSTANVSYLGYQDGSNDYAALFSPNSAGTGIDMYIDPSGSTFIDIGPDLFETGTLCNVAYDTAETLSGNLTGFNIDLSTNITQDGNTVTGLSVTTGAIDENDGSITLSLTKNLTHGGTTAIASGSTLDINSTNVSNGASGSMDIGSSIVDIDIINTANSNNSDSYSGTGIDFNYTVSTVGAGTAENTFTAMTIDYNIDEDAGTLDLSPFNVFEIDYSTVGTPDYNTGNYSLLSVVGADNNLPTYSSNSVLKGLNVDLSGINISSANLELAGIYISMPSTYGSADEKAGYFSGGGMENIFAHNSTGLRVNVNTTNASNNYAGIVSSKDLSNNSAAGALSITNNALFCESVISTYGSASGASSRGGANTAFIGSSNSTSVAQNDVYNGGTLYLNWRATTTDSGTATSNGYNLYLYHGLTETAGTLTVNSTNVLDIDITIEGDPTFASSSVFNPINIVYNLDTNADFTATSYVNGIKVDMSDANLDQSNGVIYGLDITGSPVSSATGAAAKLTDGTQTVYIGNGSAHLRSDESLITDMPVPTAGTGISDAAAYKWIPFGKKGTSGLTVTELFIDIAGLRGDNVLNDVIGNDGGTANAHFGQVTDAIHGTVVAMEIICIEAPTGADTDIDFSTSTSGTIAETADISGAAGYSQLLASGAAWTLGRSEWATALPAADSYLYLSVGAGGAGDADYTAGQFIIRFYGT